MTALADKVADLMRLRTPRAIDEDALQRQLERAAQAEELLRHPALQAAFLDLDAAYTAFWRATSPDDVETRERAWASLKVLEDVRNHLISTVREGAAAQKMLERSLRH